MQKFNCQVKQNKEYINSKLALTKQIKWETDRTLFLVPGGKRSQQQASGTSFVLAADTVTLNNYK